MLLALHSRATGLKRMLKRFATPLVLSAFSAGLVPSKISLHLYPLASPLPVRENERIGPNAIRLTFVSKAKFQIPQLGSLGSPECKTVAVKERSMLAAGRLACRIADL